MKTTTAMKTIISILTLLLLYSCTDIGPISGTLVRISTDENAPIEVYKYYYADGEYVYVARFKADTTVTTTTWSELNPATKISSNKFSVAVIE